MKVCWHDLARQEFDEAIDYYLVHAGPKVAGNFADAVLANLSLLHDHPAIGALHHLSARRIPFNGFPFDIVYRANSQRVVIIAIATQSRQPRHWGGGRGLVRRIPARAGNTRRPAARHPHGRLFVGKTQGLLDEFRPQKIAALDQGFEQRAHTGQQPFALA